MADQKILIIDDDPDIVEAMRMPLVANDYEVITAYCGTEGLRLAKDQIPDLIILDVMMETDTEGFHVAYELRNCGEDSEYKKCKGIPILMITAISQHKRMKFSPEKDDSFLPVDDFIEKPIQPKDLLERVAGFLERK